ncbi:MAG: oxidoreductase [Planctomycetaceae bacterium]|nr:oxidoreductase [Planctomycetaceae bacterium]
MNDPLRIGLIGLDTSHVIAFTELLNDPDHAHHVPGARIVAGFPGGSPDFHLSASRLEGYTNDLRDRFAVQIMDSPAAVADAVDLVFIESCDGRVHLDLFKQTVASGKPTFIDKPLAVTTNDAREIMRLANDAKVAVMSASSLRYYQDLLEARATFDRDNPIVGCDAFGPMSIEPTQPGLFWYGIHTVDIVMSVFGTGCAHVRTMKNDDFDVVTAVWDDGRVATIRGTRTGNGQFGVTLHGKSSSCYVDLTAVSRPGYATMLESILSALPAGKSDVPQDQMIQVVQLIEAANKSRVHSGRIEQLE